MKKLNLLLAIGILLSGCATNQDVSSQTSSSESMNSSTTEQDREEVTAIIDHTSMDYEIEELSVPVEFKAENYEFPIYLQDCHATSDYIYFEILNKQKRGLSEGLYRYNLEDQKAEFIKDYKDEETRLYDYITDEKGNIYELLTLNENNTSYCVVRFNNEEIVRVLPQTPFHIRQFEKLGEEIYLLAEDVVDEEHIKWLVMHFDEGKVEIVDEVVQDNSVSEVNKVDFPYLVAPNIQLNSKNWVSYATEQAGKYTVHSFNQNEKITFDVPESPINVINLKDYILVDVSRKEDTVLNPEDAFYKQYSYDVKTKELKEIANEKIGLTIQVSDHEFYSSDNFTKTKLYHFDGKELKPKVIEETPEQSLAHRAVRIDDETDFLKLEDTDGQIHFYLIHWKK
ncbi:MAG: hypothetical protein Q4A59_03730 [Erysipelotrichaceae bacterium]|nr:hypothetical protein [Erysipelotrichaceae bacterium]